ncbi:bromodomain-containing protein [Cyclospora cayetanensis]|uniref:Bromodomain-containing protein n=1 Tax=Cyclospora cayetanensis TaxID=88456 RepID=A0A1D3CZG5_9EIME|nr:bromodomain-containing protein [Cyclospora cayetanensis]
MHPRKKYRLQYQPLPAEMPDVWVDCPHEKLEEFERLFPSLAVWPPVAASASATAAGAPVPSGSDPSAPAGSSGGGSPVMGGAVDLSAAACIGRCEALMQQWQGGAHALLSGLSKYEGAHIFEKPVDRKMAPGYYDVVTRPMSLSCVRNKLKKGAYNHPHAFLADVQLIFDNCALYNQPGSWVNTIGKNMQRFFLNQVVVMRFNDYVAAFNRIYAGLQQVAQRNELHRQQHQPTTQQNSAPLKTEHAEEGAPSAADLPSAAAAPTEPSAAAAPTMAAEAAAALGATPPTASAAPAVPAATGEAETAPQS